MTPKDRQLLEYIRSFKPEFIRYVSEINEANYAKVVDSSTRHGFFILQCNTFAELNSIIEIGYKNIT